MSKILRKETNARYPIILDAGIENIPGRAAKGRIEVDLNKPADAANAIVTEYLQSRWKELICPANSAVRYPYLGPGATYDELWDWDSFFMAAALPPEGFEYARGSILGLLDGVTEDGHPPKLRLANGEYLYKAHPLPVRAQFVYLAASLGDDFEWVEPVWRRLEKIQDWYERETMHPLGLFTWMTYRGNGIDNNPGVYGRPARSSGGVDLAVWHYREYKAMARLAEKLNKDTASTWSAKADSLRETIVRRYWDRLDRCFYNIDCHGDTKQTSKQAITWDCFLKFRSWISFFPLWAGIADREQAEALKAKMLDPEEFLSDWGLRSHSKADPIYNNVMSEDPSNWQGPIWVLPTVLCAYGLNRYGWKDEAWDLALRLIRLLAADIEQNGTIHEYYNGDTGQPVCKPDFVSWNLLGLQLMSDLKTDRDCVNLDILD